MKLFKKLKLNSRKFWVTVIVSNVVIFAEKLGIEISQEQALILIGTIAPWLFTQGQSDQEPEEDYYPLRLYGN